MRRNKRIHGFAHTFRFALEQLESRELLAANAFEQHAVYLINSERHDHNVAPLAIDDRLLDSAGGKAGDLKNCFQHSCNGRDRDDWAMDAGYPKPVSQAIATYFPPGAAKDQAGKAVDLWTSNAARSVLLGDGSEIGVGRSQNGRDIYWAVHIGSSSATATYLTGVVFDDKNDNGRYDYNEGLADVNVTAGGKSTTTNAGGGWAIAVTPNQQYTVRAQGGRFSGTSSATVMVDQQNRSVDFISGLSSVVVDFGSPAGNTGGGNAGGGGSNNPPDVASGRVSGRVFVDVNRDKKLSSGEELLANWIVYVDMNQNGRRDSYEQATQTDDQGRYQFTVPLHPIRGFGHHIRIELQPDFDNTTSIDKSVLIEYGVHKTGKDFGVVRDNSISGQVFVDKNRDGTKARGEMALARWTVFIDQNGNGKREPGERHDVTNANGTYRFESVNVGSERITVVPKPGYTFTNGDTRMVSVGRGTHVVGRDFGVFDPSMKPLPRGPKAAQPQTGTVAGRVFVDLDKDGVRSPTEMTVANWRVYVDANQNKRFDANEASQLTDRDGRYQLVLPAQVQTIAVELPVGFVATSNRSLTVTVGANQIKSGKHFGVIQNTSITGEVISDLPTPGVVETWTVYVDTDGDGKRDKSELVTQTDDTGSYTFVSIPRDVHRIVVEPKPGYDLRNNGARSVSLVDRAFKSGIDFTPERRTGVVTGRIYKDNGRTPQQYDSKDTAIVNAIVFADLNDNRKRDASEFWTRTDADGKYRLVLPEGVQAIRAINAGTVLKTRLSVDLNDGDIKTNKDFRISP